MVSHGGDEQPEQPGPSLWPLGFAIGIACILVGVVISWPAVAVGAAITLVFGFLWVREATVGYRTTVAVEPETRAPVAERVPTTEAEEEPERFPRSVFLENATLGLGAVIGGVVTVPALGFAIAPAFSGIHTRHIDVGALEDFPEGQFVVTTFLSDPGQGVVSRRTAFIRNNGLVRGLPSFSIISNRCVHLGCPVQPNGPLFTSKQKTERTSAGEVTLIPTQPAGFGCPCHGGAYDTEGNRTAGPPVRALDRYEFSIRHGHLWLGKTFSVAHVVGAGGNARIKRFKLAGPGQHVSGAEAWLYPLQPPHP